MTNKAKSEHFPWTTALLFYLQADIDLSKRAGELTEEEVEKIITIMQNPRQYKIPNWFLNRQKDIKDGKLIRDKQVKSESWNRDFL